MIFVPFIDSFLISLYNLSSFEAHSNVLLNKYYNFLQKFVSLIRNQSRKEMLRKVCVEEWMEFERRIRDGDVNDAVVALVNQRQSKL